MSEKAKSERLGALWVKQSNSGNDFFSGVLEIPREVLEGATKGRNGEFKIPVVVFSVREKKKDTSPDYDILLGRDSQGGDRAKPAPRQSQREEPSRVRGNSEPPPLTDDDIPF